MFRKVNPHFGAFKEVTDYSEEVVLKAFMIADKYNIDKREALGYFAYLLGNIAEDFNKIDFSDIAGKS